MNNCFLTRHKRLSTFVALPSLIFLALFVTYFALPATVASSFISPAVCKYELVEWNATSDQLTVWVVSPACSSLFVPRRFRNVQCANETQDACSKARFPIGHKFNCTVINPPLCDELLHGTIETKQNPNPARAITLFFLIMTSSALVTALVLAYLEIKDLHRNQQ